MYLISTSRQRIGGASHGLPSNTTVILLSDSKKYSEPHRNHLYHFVHLYCQKRQAGVFYCRMLLGTQRNRTSFHSCRISRYAHCGTPEAQKQYQDFWKKNTDFLYARHKIEAPQRSCPSRAVLIQIPPFRPQKYSVKCVSNRKNHFITNHIVSWSFYHYSRISPLFLLIPKTFQKIFTAENALFIRLFSGFWVLA